jgi:hypothetical protein
VRGVEAPRRIEVYCTGTCGGEASHFAVLGYKAVEGGRAIREETEVVQTTMSEPMAQLAALKKGYVWAKTNFPGAPLRILVPGSILPQAREAWGLVVRDGQDALGEGTDPELERKVRERWEEESRRIPKGPERPAVFDVTQRVEQVRWLAKWTLGFLIANTPNPEEGLAAVLAVTEALKKQCRLTKGSLEALRKLAEDLEKELCTGGLILTGKAPKAPQGSLPEAPQAPSEEPNYYY